MVSSDLVMVGERIAPLTATPERSVTVSSYSALRHKGCCHQHRLPWISSSTTFSLVDALLLAEDAPLDLLPG
jgi:hypothetical protein